MSVDDSAAVDVQLVDNPRPCHRCLGELYLSAQVRHTEMPGLRLLVLCPACDAGKPECQDLLSYFAIHGQVDPATAATFSRLVTAWAEHPRAFDEAAFEEDVRAWRAGELD